MSTIFYVMKKKIIMYEKSYWKLSFFLYNNKKRGSLIARARANEHGDDIKKKWKLYRAHSHIINH